MKSKICGILLTLTLLAGCTYSAATDTPDVVPTATSKPTATDLPVEATTLPTATDAPDPVVTPTRVPDSDVYWPTEGWRTSTPEAQGMDPAPLAHMLESIMQQGLNVHSVLVVRNGYIVAEKYFFPITQNRKHQLWSVTKSVTSALVGIAIERGYVDGVDAPVLDFFPDYTFANVDGSKRALTLEHLLTMSSGLTWTDAIHIAKMLQSPDSVQFALDLRMAAEPGTRWSYNTGNSHLLSAILQETTGLSAQEFAQAHLFGPLGISDFIWESDRNGVSAGGWGLWMKPRDMAKIGYLYLNEGVWDGQQLVPAQWVRDSVERKFQVPNPLEPWDLYYGYGWWLHEIGAYAAHGRYGQFIYVIPDLDVVVVFTSGLDEADFVQPELLIQDYVMPAVVASNSPSQDPASAEADLPGHQIRGDTVTFLFDEAAHALEGQVGSVGVVGNFNAWDDTATEWQMSDDDGDGVWTLEVPLGGAVKIGSKFGFAADGQILEPPPEIDRDRLLPNDQGEFDFVVGDLTTLAAEDKTVSRLEHRSYTDAGGNTLPYYLLVPENYDPSETYPLVLFLHGAGERGDSLAPVLPGNGAYEFIETAGDRAYFMVVPQCPNGTWWGGDAMLRLVLALLDDVCGEFSIDKARIYATGLSMGGMGMWELVARAPNVFAAGVAVCGGPWNVDVASQIAHIPFWVLHGSDDPYAPVDDARQIVAALQEAGGSVEYTEYEGAGHFIWGRTYSDPQVIDWLFAQKR